MEFNRENIDQAHEYALFLEGIQKQWEAEKQGNGKAHFMNNPDFNFQDLTLEDKEVYDKLQNGMLTREEFAAYAESVRSAAGPVVESNRNSRTTFLAYMNNLVGVFFYRRDKQRQLEELKKKTGL